MSNSVPVTIQGLSGSKAGSGGATVLTQAQANQLVQQLRSIQGSGASGGSGTQAIKIHAIQTNPTTGARQIVVIPSSSGSASNTSSSGIQIANTSRIVQHVQQSPGKKVIKIQAAAATAPGSSNSSTSFHHTPINQADMPPGVKVVKISTASGTQPGQVRTVYSPQVVTPSKIVSASSTPTMQVMSSDPLSANDSRKRSDIDFDAFSDVKRRKTEKGGKGLRHFSMKVCEKVQAKGSTSYNEVADELVNELTDPRCTSPTDQQYDQKNIRRRVYDALNVLMAMNIISKEKKEIRWLGLPTNSIQEANGLEMDKSKRMERIKAKTTQLHDLILQLIAFKNLVERNKDREKRDGPPTPNSAIQLPFIIVNTSKKTVIDCSISNDKMEYLFNFDDTFEIHDDMEVLKRMGLSFGLERGEVTPEDLSKARTMVPRALEQYVVELAQRGPGDCSSIPKVTPAKILKEEAIELPLALPLPPGMAMAESSANSENDDSDVDIN